MRVITALVRREEHFVAILSPTLRCETASNWEPELFCPIRLITVRKLPMGGVPIGADRAVADAPLDQLLAVRRIGGQVISRIECSLVVGEEYRAPFSGIEPPLFVPALAIGHHGGDGEMKALHTLPLAGEFSRAGPKHA
jgi:hypothetical protein